MVKGFRIILIESSFFKVNLEGASSVFRGINLKTLIHLNWYKACAHTLFFILYHMIALQKLWKKLLFHLKSSFCSWDIHIFVIFPFFSTFQIQKDKWKWNNWCYEMACIEDFIFRITQNLPNTESSNLVSTSLIMEFSWTCFVTWRSAGT